MVVRRFFGEGIKTFCIITAVMVIVNCSASYQPVALNPVEHRNVSEVVNSVSVERLKSTINTIANCRHPVADSAFLVETLVPYIFSEFLSLNCEIFEDRFDTEHGGYSCNLYAVKKGSDTTRAPVIVSAHWDTPKEGYPGADDNASGCTALLEIARVLSDVRVERTVIFVMFGLEEVGYLGAYAHMKRFKDTPPHILVNLDGIAYTSPSSPDYNMFGIPKKNDFIMIAGMQRDRDYAYHFCDIIDQFVPALRYYCVIEDEDLVNNPIGHHLQSSDHVVFWQHKQHALFITDTGPLRYPYYHSPEDIVERIDEEFFRNVTAATAAFVYVEAMRL